MPDDADSLAEMWLALVAYHQTLNQDLPGAAQGGDLRYSRRILERLDDPFTRTLIAEVEGQPVGFALGMIVDLMPDIFAQEPTGFLADIYVEPEFRRLGIGRALVKSLRDWFRQQDVRYFDWHVAAHNPQGLAFWRSVGGRDVMLRMRADVNEDQHD
jgi:ribosomal protein S18 acetylase RimI-like enzyme